MMLPLEWSLVSLNTVGAFVLAPPALEAIRLAMLAFATQLIAQRAVGLLYLVKLILAMPPEVLLVHVVGHFDQKVCHHMGMD